MEHRFNDVPVSARQHLPENRTRNLDEEGFAFGPVQMRWLEPRGEGVDAYPGLNVF